MAGIKKTADKCLSLFRAGARGDRRDAVEELERKVSALSEQMALKHNGKKHIQYEPITVWICLNGGCFMLDPEHI